MRPFFDKRGKIINDGEPVYLGVPNNQPFFNRGLGMVTYGTKDAERKARALGLRPIGDAKPQDLYKQEKKDDITPILVEGMKKVRANKIKNGEL
jgi:hypothetical protein